MNHNFNSHFVSIWLASYLGGYVLDKHILILFSDEPDETIIKTEHLQDEESNMNFVVNELESSVTADSEAAIKTTTKSEIVANENEENTSIEEEEPQLMSYSIFRCPMCDQRNPQKSNVEKHMILHHKLDIDTLKVFTILFSSLYR